MGEFYPGKPSDWELERRAQKEKQEQLEKEQEAQKTQDLLEWLVIFAN